MNTTTIRGMLSAAIFTGAIGVAPLAAMADEGGQPTGTDVSGSVPDHQEAQEASTSGTLTPLPPPSTVPDHQEAEEASTSGTLTPLPAPSTVPDHQEAEARGASIDVGSSAPPAQFGGTPTTP